MLHSFLMIGQSNMAGRGFLNDVPLIYNHQISMLRNGRWQTMWEPVNYDRPNAGIGLAASFAAAWHLSNETGKIGLIPCADGGTSLADWDVNGALFQHAVSQAKLAQKTSSLQGILWHQGENDSQPDNARYYGEKFAVIIKTLREELGVPDIPLLIGGLGDFLTEGVYGAYFASYTEVNQALKKYAENNPNCYFVTASGLTANPDKIHIDASSQRIFGVRYFESFQKKQHVFEPLKNETETVEQIYRRQLSPAEEKGLADIEFSMGKLSVDAYKAKISTLM